MDDLSVADELREMVAARGLHSTKLLVKALTAISQDPADAMTDMALATAVIGKFVRTRPGDLRSFRDDIRAIAKDLLTVASTLDAAPTSSTVLPYRDQGVRCHECGNVNIVRTGTCLTCLVCGSTTGCG